MTELDARGPDVWAGWSPGTQGVIKHVVYPAGVRLTGKERGEWMKLTDDEAALIRQRRAPKP